MCAPLRKSHLRRQATAEPRLPPATPSRQQPAPPPLPATQGAQQTGYTWPTIGTWQGKLLYGGGLLLLAALCFSAGRSLAGCLGLVFFGYILWDPLSECADRGVDGGCVTGRPLLLF